MNATRVGLECAIFSKKYPNMDMVSIGPDMSGVYTPKETLDLESTDRAYKFLKELVGSSRWGIGMSNERNLESEGMCEREELGTVVLTSEDGGGIECGILGVFGVGRYDSDYIAPVSENDNEIMIYKCEEINKGEADLNVIEDDAKHERTKETFEFLFVDFDRKDEE